MADIPFFKSRLSVDATECFVGTFELGIGSVEYIGLETKSLYRKILRDCVSRIVGLTSVEKRLFYDSCLNSDAQKGIVTLLVDTMYTKSTIYLVYDKKIKFVRVATSEEQQQIKDGSLLKNVAVCSFSAFEEISLIKIYMAMMFSSLNSLNTQVNIAKAILFKFKSFRDKIAGRDLSSKIPEAAAMNTGLKAGKGLMCDSEDKIESIKLDVAPSKATQDIIEGRMANVTGMPISYINGALSAGISATGEADSSAVERGLEPYFNSIIKPVADALFSKDVQFKSDNWRMLSERVNALPIIEMSQIIDDEQKASFVAELFPKTEA